MNPHMSVGWCAGRPADHGVADEFAVARMMLDAYPQTSAVREFRGNTAPSEFWWETQTLGAASLFAETEGAVRTKRDAVVSWNHVAGRDLGGFLGNISDWVEHLRLIPRHEAENPDKNVTPAMLLEDFRWVREAIGPRGTNPRVSLGPAFILYRARDPENKGTAGDFRRYLDPLVEEDLIDFHAWDGYPSNPDETRPWAPVEYEHPADFSELPESVSFDTGLPYAWAELHHDRIDAVDPNGVTAARWHAGMVRHARASNALFVTQFHYNMGDFLAPGGGQIRRAEYETWLNEILTATQFRALPNADVTTWNEAISAAATAIGHEINVTSISISETLSEMMR